MKGYLTTIGAQKLNIIIIGDSTIDGSTYADDVATYLNADSEYIINDVSTWGNNISQQKTAYSALSAAIKRDVDYVFVQIGLNDVRTNGETYSTPYVSYLDLITTIQAAGGPRTKIVGSCVLKIKGATDVGDDPLAWSKLTALNADILAKNFTGMDLSTNVASETLSDSNGYLLAMYELFDPQDHVHENNAGRQIIADSWEILIT